VIFRNRTDRPWGPPSLLYNGYRVFPAGKAAGVKERVELYIYSPLGLRGLFYGERYLYLHCLHFLDDRF